MTAPISRNSSDLSPTYEQTSPCNTIVTIALQIFSFIAGFFKQIFSYIFSDRKYSSQEVPQTSQIRERPSTPSSENMAQQVIEENSTIDVLDETPLKNEPESIPVPHQQEIDPPIEVDEPSLTFTEEGYQAEEPIETEVLSSLVEEIEKFTGETELKSSLIPHMGETFTSHFLQHFLHQTSVHSYTKENDFHVLTFSKETTGVIEDLPHPMQPVNGCTITIPKKLSWKIVESKIVFDLYQTISITKGYFLTGYLSKMVALTATKLDGAQSIEVYGSKFSCEILGNTLDLDAIAIFFEKLGNLYQN